MTAVRSSNRTYVALIGDIRASREVEDRSALQDRFETVLDGLNEALSGSLASRLVVTTGDEFQGLFDQPRAALAAMTGVAEGITDVTFSFGLGRGGLDTRLRERAVGMDGPCFHRARQGLEAAREQERWARVAGFGERVDTVANGLLAALGAIRSDWTDKQTRYVRITREHATQKDASASAGISPSTLSEALKAAHYRELLEAEGALAKLLEATGWEEPG